MTPQPDRRRPRWIYGQGSEPDYRFTLANERTLLAWLRTALALLAAGAAMGALIDLGRPNLELLLAVALSALGILIALAGWLRWACAERAIRRNEPLPSLGGSALFGIALAAAGAVLLVVLL